MTPTQVLYGLRDVRGVVGSFVLSGHGELVAKDLPSVFYDDLFANVGPRLLRLLEALRDGGGEPSHVILRFLDHKLHVQGVGPGVLCVLSEPEVNLSTLRVGVTLVARRVMESVTSLTNKPPDVALEIERSSGVPAEPGSTAPPPSVQQKLVTYRGRRI